MSIENIEPTGEPVETPESAELTTEETETAAGGIRRGGAVEGGEGGDPGDGGKEIKYL
jgi:hypothetical protein